MAGSNKPLPKTQSQISQDSINPFQGGPASGSKQPIQDLKKGNYKDLLRMIILKDLV